MMRRHLLTLFALFTGLAALQTPAQASSHQSMVAGASAFASAAEAAQAERGTHEADARAKEQQGLRRTYEAPLQQTPAAIRAGVEVGPDRALE